MGIVRLRGREAMRLLAHARERAGEPTSSEAHGIGLRRAVDRRQCLDNAQPLRPDARAPLRAFVGDETLVFS